MSIQWQAELEIAVAMGLVSAEDSDDLLARAKARRQSPAELLLEMGLLSQETLGRLRARLTDSGDAAKNGALAFPTALGSRYERKALLGQGGMGQVHLAWDCRLKRHVAVKIFHRREPGAANRLLREARAQAQLNHDRICKVFDVGEADGLAYIAMEYIEGEPLSRIAGELSPRALADIVRQAAEAVEEAHDAGLVHRDIKPSNIMVREERGRRLAYILDFGLAFQWDSREVTRAEAGTPWFMAPEQALGKVGCLDPRTDVYGLGATLYWCLTGQPPVGGANALEVLANIPEEEPQAPSALARRVPRDLECITLECLKKQRADRYPSARDLAADLARFLRGEAVAARGRDPVYRFSRLLRRHKALSAALATALLALLGLLATAYWLRQAADRRAERVRALTQRSEEIEAMARYLAMSPRHDIRQGRAEIRLRLEALRAEATANGNDDGAGDYALGRAYLALGRQRLARDHLDRAWALGFRDSACAYARARALGALYQLELSALASISDEGVSEPLRREAERELRDPALALLAHVEKDGSRFPWHVEALIAYYEARFEDALAILAKSAGQAPWFYEARILEGDIYSAALETGRGLSAEGAAADYRQGRAAYEAAARSGQSDVAPYLAEARLHAVAMRQALLEGAPAEPAFEAGMAALEKALRIDPDGVQAHVQQARLLKTMAEDLRNHGRDHGKTLERATAAAERAISLEPESAAGLGILAEIHIQRAFYLREKTGDPSALLDQALAVLDGTPAQDRNYRFFFNRGLAHKVRADYLAQRGGDALADREAAAAAYRRAIELDSDAPGAHLNLGLELFQLAGHREGLSRERGLEQAIAVFQQARNRSPRHLLPYFYLAQCYHGLGKLVSKRGDDPGLPFAQALAWFEQAVAVNGRVPVFHQGMAVVWLDWAKYRHFAGQAIETYGVRVEASCEKALTLNPKDGLTHLTRAVWRLLEGHDRLKRGLDSEEAWRQGRMSAEQALTHLPNLPQALVSAAEIELGAAAWSLASGRDPKPQLAAADALLARARAVNPGADFLFFAEAVRQDLLARSGAAEPAAAFDRADCAFRRALALAPARLEYRLAYADHLLRRAAWLRRQGEDCRAVLEQARAELGVVIAAAEACAEAETLWALAALCVDEPDPAAVLVFEERATFPPLVDRLRRWLDRTQH